MSGYGRATRDVQRSQYLIVSVTSYARMPALMRSAPRPRHAVGSATLTVLRPFFRHSLSRDAYVLRGVGNRLGPVLQERARKDRLHHVGGGAPEA